MLNVKKILVKAQHVETYVGIRSAHWLLSTRWTLVQNPPIGGIVEMFNLGGPDFKFKWGGGADIKDSRLIQLGKKT